MEDFVVRLIEEQKQLEDRMEKLSTFLASEKFDSIDDDGKSLLNIQYFAMSTYNQCLKERLSRLK